MSENEAEIKLQDFISCVRFNEQPKYTEKDWLLAIETILDLYQKEKEKNNADFTAVYLDGFFDGKIKWKNKIKEKIEYYKAVDDIVSATALELLLKEENTKEVKDE